MVLYSAENFSTAYAAAEDNPDPIIVFAFIVVDLRQLLSSGLSSITRVQSAILKERVLNITHPRSSKTDQVALLFNAKNSQYKSIMHVQEVWKKTVQ